MMTTKFSIIRYTINLIASVFLLLLPITVVAQFTEENVTEFEIKNYENSQKQLETQYNRLKGALDFNTEEQFKNNANRLRLSQEELFLELVFLNILIFDNKTTSSISYWKKNTKDNIDVLTPLATTDFEIGAIKLLNGYYQFMANRDKERALAQFNQSLNLLSKYKTNSAKLLQLRIYSKLIPIYHLMGDYQQVEDISYDFLRLAEEIGHPYFMGQTQTLVGDELALIGQPQLGLTYLIQALENTAISNSKLANARLQFALARAYNTLNRSDLAVKHANNTIKIYQKMDYITGLSRVYTFTANLYLAKENYPRALDYFLNALELNKKMESLIYISVNAHNVAYIYNLMNDEQQALNYINKSSKIFSDMNNVTFLAKSHLLKAEVFYKLKQYDDAIIYINKSINFSKEKNQTDDYHKGIILKSKILSNLKQYKDAINLTPIIIDNFKDKLAEASNATTQQILNKHNSQLDTTKIKLDLKLSEIKAGKYANYNQILIIFIAILLSSLLIFLISNRILHKKINKLTSLDKNEFVTPFSSASNFLNLLSNTKQTNPQTIALLYIGDLSDSDILLQQQLCIDKHQELFDRLRVRDISAYYIKPGCILLHSASIIEQNALTHIVNEIVIEQFSTTVQLAMLNLPLRNDPHIKISGINYLTLLQFTLAQIRDKNVSLSLQLYTYNYTPIKLALSSTPELLKQALENGYIKISTRPFNAPKSNIQ